MYAPPSDKQILITVISVSGGSCKEEKAKTQNHRDPRWQGFDIQRTLSLIVALVWYASTSLVSQMVKDLPAVWETWVRSLGWDDPLGKEWQPTPVFLPGEFQGQRSLEAYNPWGH